MTSWERRGQSHGQMALIRKPEGEGWSEGGAEYLCPPPRKYIPRTLEIAKPFHSDSIIMYLLGEGWEGDAPDNKNTNHPQSHTSGDLEEEA